MLETHAGAFYDALAHAEILGPGGPKKRQRRRRSDGLRNQVALAVACIASADPRGFLGRPRHDEAGWDRLSWGLIDHYAYGKRVENERSFRRTQRHLREFAALGFIRTRQVRVKTPHGWESLVAFKHLTEKFWRMLGVWESLRSLVRKRQQEKDAARARELGLELAPRGSNVGAARRNVGAAMPFVAALPVPPPTPPPDPAASDPVAVKARFEEIQKLLRGK